MKTSAIKRKLESPEAYRLICTDMAQQNAIYTDTLILFGEKTANRVLKAFQKWPTPKGCRFEDRCKEFEKSSAMKKAVNGEEKFLVKQGVNFSWLKPNRKKT